MDWSPLCEDKPSYTVSQILKNHRYQAAFFPVSTEAFLFSRLKDLSLYLRICENSLDRKLGILLSEHENVLSNTKPENINR